MRKDCASFVEKMRRISSASFQKQNYEKALAAVSSAAYMLYTYNQTYTDDEFEQLLQDISKRMLPERSIWRHDDDAEDKTVLFYDGFGLDTRGLALIYLKGLARCGYRVIYVVSENAKGNQPEIAKAVDGYDFHWVYIPTVKNYHAWIHAIADAFDTYRPHSAFFYTTPWDVAAMVAFSHYAGSVIRYQIDLTDHAFWLGKCAFDYCLSLRDLGSKIACNYRGMEPEKIRMLPYYATINYDAPFMGFPFPVDGKRVIFSGGELYKTLGDGENTYYSIVDSILDKHEDIIFLYAGRGDDSELKVIMEKYPERAFHIDERKDLYQVMRNCVLYLNTYPMFGGLMMNYAASAGKIPLTLKHNHDADGLLFNQGNIGIEYDTKEELLADVDKLLADPAYLSEREQRLNGCVITQEQFEANLKQLVDTQTTQYPIYTETVDTSQFRQEYVRRFDYNSALYNSVIKACSRPLITVFPFVFFRYYLKRISEILSNSVWRNKK